MRTRLLVLPFLIAAIAVGGWIAAPVRPFAGVPYSRVAFDADGRLLGAAVAADGQWRFPSGAGQPPTNYVRALLTFEDQRFYRHVGVDPVAVLRAAASNRAAGRIVSGGSTLTMQLARLLSGDRAPTLRRKIAEAVVAVRLELRLSKGEIIRLFADHAPLGGNVVGVEAAAWRYFGRPSAEITDAEVALLAVLPNSPGLMNLGRGRGELLDKRNRLLARLFEQGDLDAERLDLALAEPIPDRPLPLPQRAPHLLQTLSSRNPDRWRFDTSLSGFLQDRASEVVAQHGDRLRGLGVEHAAALIVHVPSGDVVAYVGNLPIRAASAGGDFVDIVQAPRSTGSLLKPVLYAAMLDAGELLPRQLVADIPTRIGGYIPENHTGDYSGAVRADVALARSLNVPAARLLRDYGVDRFYGLLKAMGLSTLTRPASHYGIPLILGGAESTLWELTHLYAAMAREVGARGWTNESEYTAGSRGPAAPAVAPDRSLTAEPLSPGAIYLALEALRSVQRPEELVGWQYFAGARDVSWKTGTSYGLRDAWAIGVTSAYAVGVWVGNASGAGAPGLRGTATAAPTMFQLFELLPRSEPLSPPPGLRTVRVCADSGYLAGPDCRSSEAALVPQGSHDHPVCPYCRTVHLNAERTHQVTADVYPVSRMVHEPWFVLPPAMAWYFERRSVAYVPPPPVDPRLAASGSMPLGVEFPLPGSRVYIPVEMSGRRGSLVATARHADPQARLYWHLGDEYLGSTTEPHTLELRPARGDHLLTVIDDGGRTVTVPFRVESDL